MITLQLLGKDGSSLDDTKVLSGRWQAYVEGFVSEGETPGVPALPDPRRSVTHPTTTSSLDIQYRQQVSTHLGHSFDEDTTLMSGGLEIKVFLRTYHVSRTEDVLWHIALERRSKRGRVA